LDQIKFGQSITRREDDRLLTGRGEYTDDFQLPGALHVVFVRSPCASAMLRSVDTSAALAHPGVAAVLTGADLAADGVSAPATGPTTGPTARPRKSMRRLPARRM
jgi:carbon-monoxide dehydrogenase large subunit